MASKAELLTVWSGGGAVLTSPVAVDRSLRTVSPLQCGGGLTITMPPHRGQARIWPIAAGSRTRKRDLQVVQTMENRSIQPPRGRVVR
jgi:hypothetical protein